MNIGHETETIEFKKSTGELKEGIISLSSMLNKHSDGAVYFGVKNNGDALIGESNRAGQIRGFDDYILGKQLYLFAVGANGDKSVFVKGFHMRISGEL